MTDAPRRRSAGPDPDRLAALEEEQRHLLRSLDDLDTELGAGDIDADDHDALVDDYTRRAAAVTRELRGEQAAMAAGSPPTPRLQRWLTVAGIVLIAVIAGVLLARSSGFRTPDATVSGDIRRSSAGLLAEADTLTREGRWQEARDVYDEVLELSPANVEALTYRGWITSRLGDDEAGLATIEEAVAIDPEFPDARAFAAILHNSAQRFDEAAGHLRALDELDTTGQIEGLIAGAGLRPSVAAGQIAERFRDGTPIDLAQIDASLDTVALAGGVLDPLDPVLALRVYDAVLDADPQNLTALLNKGRRLGTDPDIRAVEPGVADEGLRLLDEAVDVAPDSPIVRVFRAYARVVADDRDGARADLELVDRDQLDDDFAALLDELNAALG